MLNVGGKINNVDNFKDFAWFSLRLLLYWSILVICVGTKEYWLINVCFLISYKTISLEVHSVLTPLSLIITAETL